MRLGLITVFILSLSLGFEAETTAPKLTDVQRLTLQNKVLRARLAQAELDATVKEYSVPGYDLTADGDFVKKADAP